MNIVCTCQQPNTALQRTEQRLSVRVRVCLPPLSFTVSWLRFWIGTVVVKLSVGV
ncbi:MAG: hypothetical protein IGS49_23740 [Chlorogloeopsis fritschii C42_A2020_084]|jgi:hypothetical protein|uniref:hypothetical protein n=1 Tax=Chlorogloeopsis fritschii TaxID=1124 RepID=UPI001A0D4C7E|nr:hypothetical protein [Chlorogloeopsis fritschii]MBF2008371.1 hypothetical protein [Chlorogloeopsis fritschii C42_A2020_084]